MPRIDHADTLAHWLRLLAPSIYEAAEREYRFAPPRRWRFDFAWPAARVAVEVDGGRWKAGGGRHASSGDYEKIRAAVLLDWRVLRYTSAEVTGEPHDVVMEINNFLGKYLTSE